MTGNTEDVLYIQCDDGYSGSGESRCTADGTFTTVTCTADPCTSTQVAFSSTHSRTDSVEGNTDDWVDVQCLDGYTASNHDTSVPIEENVACQNSYELSDSSTSLSACLSLATSEHCREHGNGFTVSYSASTGVCRCSTDSCDTRRSLSGYHTYDTSGRHGRATCAASGEFNTVTCNPNSCTSISVANSNYSTSSSLSGVTTDTRYVECNLGYIGGGSTTCLSTGEFSAVVPCRRWRCTEPEVLNGQFDNTSWVDLNDEDELVATRITCDRNYHRSTSVTSFACDCT